MRASPWPALPRADAPEWLDQGRGAPADVAANLAEMWRLNRLLGGVSALTRHLYPLLHHHPGPAALLDLGTGAADLPRAIARWAARHRQPVTITAVDWAARHLAVARARPHAAVHLLQADALRLPLAPQSVDYVLATLFLHHFAPAAAVDLLRTAFAHARRALIVSDLVRGRWPLLAFALVRPALARHPFTWHDGQLSIRRAYTPAELRALALEAGLPQPRVYAHWPWRMTLVVERHA
jgi:hypothetical protein